jgi:hypothetical protein
MNLLSPTDRVLNYKFLLGIVSVPLTLSLLIKVDEVTAESSGSALHGNSYIWWDLTSIHSGKRGSGALENEISQAWSFASIYWAFFTKQENNALYGGHVSPPGPLWPGISPQNFGQICFKFGMRDSLNDTGEFWFSATFIHNKIHFTDSHKWIFFIKYSATKRQPNIGEIRYMRSLRNACLPVWFLTVSANLHKVINPLYLLYCQDLGHKDLLIASLLIRPPSSRTSNIFFPPEICILLLS